MRGMGRFDKLLKFVKPHRKGRGTWGEGRVIRETILFSQLHKICQAHLHEPSDLRLEL